MVPKKQRLEIGDPLKTRHFYLFRGSSLVIKYFPNTYSRARIAVIVSKKVHRNATKRNYSKRRILGIFREISGFEVPFDVLCIPQKGFDDLSNEQLRIDLIQFLNILKEQESTQVGTT